jgi:predicted nucleic acid-binding protein
VTGYSHDWMQLFPVVSATSKSFTKAINTVNVHILSFWDAILWAVAREAGVTLLLSDNLQHDQVLDGIRFCNPYKLDHPIDYIFNDNQRE